MRYQELRFYPVATAGREFDSLDIILHISDNYVAQDLEERITIFSPS